jgi:hypothetical protein
VKDGIAEWKNDGMIFKPVVETLGLATIRIRIHFALLLTNKTKA